MSGYQEYAASGEYLHLLSGPAWMALRPRLAAELTDVDPAAGPVLELGAGTGLGTDVLLETLTNDVLAAEPSASLRGVLLARLADRATGRVTGRVTVYPSGATEVPLPDRIAAVVGMHMVGHLTPPDRKRLWAAIAERLAPGGPVVLNVQPPAAPEVVPEFPWMGASVGGLVYEGTGSAEPTGPDSVCWRMRYRTRRADGTVLAEASAEYTWWTVSADGLAAELADAGLVATVDNDLVVARTVGA
jgi:SAM-dependent methyltransferase